MSISRRLSRTEKRVFRIFCVLIPVIAAGTGCFFLFQAELNSPLPTLVIVDRNGRYICDVRDGGTDAEAGYWPVSPVPERISATVLAMEDRRFTYHPGVDPIGVCRAILQNLQSRRTVSGASTVAMQVVRLQRPSPRTYPSKIREMISAVALTVRYGRESILDHYLRLAPYGNGIRGIGYAAHCYFAKPVEDLSWAEIAFLSAIPQHPARMNPRTGSGRVRVVARALKIIDTVYERGFLSDAEAERARMQVAGIELVPRQGQSSEAVHLAVRYRELFGEAGNRDMLQSPVVKTGIDLSLQDEITQQAALCVDAWTASGAENAAVMVLDVRSRTIIALVGSTDYFDESKAGAIDYTRVRRSPGSTLKPFIYALAMDKGVIYPGSRLVDHVSHAAGFRNFDGVWLGEISVHQALASSRNVPAVDLLRQTGVSGVFGYLADLSLHGYEREINRYGLGLAVGGLPVTMERLAEAYLVFSQDGFRKPLKWFNDQQSPFEKKVFSPATVVWINQTLSDPMARLPSFPRMGHLEYEYPVAVKTGTSEGCRDAWTAAWSPDYLTLVWIGRPDGRPMRHVSGYRTAAQLAHVVMDRLHQNDGDYRGRNSHAVPSGWGVKEQISRHETAAGRNEPQTVTGRHRSDPAIKEASIRITSPENGAVYYFDPDVPADYSTLLLAVDVSPVCGSVTWAIDGIPYDTLGSPFLSRWKMIPGIHRIGAETISPRSSAEITIQVMPRNELPDQAAPISFIQR